MAKRRVAKKPLDQAAVDAANKAVEPETGGRPLKSHEVALREKWMDAYIAAGGEIIGGSSGGGGKAKKPEDPSEHCDASLTVIVVMNSGDPVPDAQVQVSQADTGFGGGNTDASGVFDSGCLSPGEYDVVVSKVGFGPTETSPEGEAVAQTVKVDEHQNTIARFVLEPVLPEGATFLSWPSGAEHKQWVNLGASASNPERGQKIKLLARLKAGTTGAKVYAKLEHGADNKGKAKVVSAGAQTAAWCPDGGAIEPMKGDDGTSGCDAEIELDLGHVGGDVVTVHIGNSEACNHTTLKIVNWRKLYYQQTRMKPTYSFPFDKVVGEYKDHFIALSSSRATLEATHKENLETDELKDFAQKYFKKTRSPLEAHVLLIDRQCDSKSDTIAASQSVMSKDYLRGAEIWPFSDWLVSQTAFQAATLKSTNTFAVTKAGSTVTVDFSGSTIDPADGPVHIVVSVKLLKGEYTGDATYPPNVFVATGNPRSDASKSKTLAHEIGHGIGMVPTAGHTRQYDGRNGGLGSHCRDGATPDQASKAQGGAFAGEYSGGTCVMFAFSSEHYKFCSTCDPVVLNAKLAKADMQARKWG